MSASFWETTVFHCCRSSQTITWCLIHSFKVFDSEIRRPARKSVQVTLTGKRSRSSLFFGLLGCGPGNQLWVDRSRLNTPLFLSGMEISYRRRQSFCSPLTVERISWPMVFRFILQDSPLTRHFVAILLGRYESSFYGRCFQ